jgi:taurine dioxygenase
MGSHVRLAGKVARTVMEIRPLGAHTGAEVLGVDLTRPVAALDREAMNRAFVERSVLVVRDQALKPHQVLAAVELFGTVFPQHNTKFVIPECPQIHYVSNQDRYPDGRRYIPGDGWHTDHSNAARPPKATALHAVSLPDKGGDTQYANMAAAYAALPSATQERIAPLTGIHVYQSSHSARKLISLTETDQERVPNAVLHPLVRTHPENGARSIYINPIRIEGILGLDHKEALPLLGELLEHATAERFQYRHAWKPGDLVLWDNRCLLHKANGDYDMSQTRYLYRVMLQGDLPR